MATYAFTDLHGNYNIWQQIKDYLQEDDIAIFLGDAIDRGDRGFEIFVELLADDRIVYLRGNHEQMMYDAWFNRHADAFSHWKRNGGQETLNNINKLNWSIEEKDEIIRMVTDLPYQVEYVNPMGYKIQLTHAGYTPNESWDRLEDYEKKYRLLWSRTHFFDTWPICNDIIIHGHTPIQYMIGKGALNTYDNGSVKLEYSQGHKICIDMGTYNSNSAILFNLDTLKVQQIFYDNTNNNNN